MSRKACEILLLVVIAVCLTPVARGDDTIVSNGLRYEVLGGDSTVRVLGVVDDYRAEGAVIPSMVADYKVTEVASGAFAQCQWLTSLSLPATLTAIGDGAFAGCDSLTTIFSHVPDASLVLPHVPTGALLAVDGPLHDTYSQYNGILKTLVDIDNVPGSACLSDVTHDGIVTAADVTQVYNNLLGYDQAHGDANGDGIVTAADVTAVYDALLAGSTNGVGDKGYCFVVLNPIDGSVMMRVGETLRLAVGAEVRLAAHDNERVAVATSGLGVIKGPLPSGEVTAVDGAQVLSLNNRHYTTGAVAPVVMHIDVGDTIYYKDVQVEVARHVVTDTLRVLSIGNSFSLDALSYVPFVMKAVAPEIYLKLDIMYIGAGSLNEFYNALDSTTWAPVDPGTPTSFIHYWSHGAQPWDALDSVPMTDVIASHPWDVIVLQQQSSLSRDYSTYQPYLNQIIDWLGLKVTSPHEYAWLITPSFPDNQPRLAPDTTSVQMFERIAQCVSQLQLDTGIELLLPCGTAIQNARTTPLDSLGDLGHLFDDLHLQEGIPCLIEAYAATATLLARYGLSERVWTDTTWVDPRWLLRNNIQELNGLPVGMSEENRAIAKQCAVKAIESPLSITAIEAPLR